MICVYEPDCTDFSNNGLGAVMPMSCSVTETLNGEWELTLVHDIDGIHKYDGIDGCQRSLLPGFNLRQQLVRDRRYHAFTHVEAVDVPDLI